MPLDLADLELGYDELSIDAEGLIHHEFVCWPDIEIEFIAEDDSFSSSPRPRQIIKVIEVWECAKQPPKDNR